MFEIEKFEQGGSKEIRVNTNQISHVWSIGNLIYGLLPKKEQIYTVICHLLICLQKSIVLDGWVGGWMDEWVDGWMGGWMGGRAGLRIAYSDQKTIKTFNG